MASPEDQTGTLADFRALFWTGFREPKGLRSKRYKDVSSDLYLIPDTLAGPLFTIFTRGECDYVFADRERFPTIRDPESFLAWCIGLVDDYRSGLSKAGATSGDEKFDQTVLLERAKQLERLSRMAYDIVSERWRRRAIIR